MPIVCVWRVFALSYHIRSLRERGTDYLLVSVCRCYLRIFSLPSAAVAAREPHQFLKNELNPIPV
ncbi:hypothetical protein [Methanimicrococcus stummii]|uniref:hypothetical protein n=1 Tax=Methanimicrococcus stummii TaxID=3028294 RepID=UPI00292EDF1E|nr:hypothetical protein [Methanimicrococcus sp. Es2]